MSHLTCPSCRFTVSATAVSPFQSCPRCLMRENLQVELVAVAEPPVRFARRPQEFSRIAEAKSRLLRPLRRADSA
jgi:hypothetical protein